MISSNNNRNLFWSEKMNISITLVRLTLEEYEDYVKQIQSSNMPLFTQNCLIDVLKTALQHSDDAYEMGWLS